MLQRHSYVPDNVYALADHLDAVIAACEDLLALNGRHADLEWLLASVRRFELAAILQVLRARQYAEELRGSEAQVGTVALLFLASTAAFTEATRAQVERVLDPENNGARSGGLVITDQFLIGRRVPIGVLLQMTGAFLDALELTYVIYDAETPRALRSSAPAKLPLPPPLTGSRAQPH
jgi:hypothetical protein